MAITLSGNGQVIVQVINASLTSTVSTSSTSYIDTGLTATITPKSSSNRILIFVGLNNISQNSGSVVGFNIVRGATTLINNTSGGYATTNLAWITGGGGGMSQDSRKINSGAMQYIDSPATTSATTYKVQMKTEANTGYLNQWALNSDVGSVSFITLMEISG
jgi:hypothetical protein